MKDINSEAPEGKKFYGSVTSVKEDDSDSGRGAQGF